MTPQELADEKIIAGIFQRPMRYFIKDKPFYPYCPPNDYYPVNFDLNYPK